MIDYITKYWVGWALGLITTGIAYLWRQAQKERKARQAIQEGVRALLRDRIIQMYGICKSKEFCSLPEREALDSLYKAYHDGLGGNGTVTDVFTAMRKMPTEKERKEPV